MSLPALGIDIAKNKFDASLYVPEQDHYVDRVFPNTPEGIQALLAWVQAQGHVQVHASLEATGTYGDQVAQQLHAAHHVVSVLNPAVLKAFRQSTLTRTKNDRTDAHLLAHYVVRHHPPAWEPPAPELRELQALARRLESLHQLRQEERNRLSTAERSAAVAESIALILAALDQEIKRVEQLIHDHIEHHPHLKEQHQLICSIPGLGDKTATTVLAECGEVTRFTSARALAAFVGVTPKQFESGSSIHRRPSLSKLGVDRLRKALYFPAISVRRFNPVVKAFCERLLARGKPKMAVIGAAMRKLLHLIYGVLKSGKPFDPEYGKVPSPAS
jgi:transposase